MFFFLQVSISNTILVNLHIQFILILYNILIIINNIYLKI